MSGNCWVCGNTTTNGSRQIVLSAKAYALIGRRMTPTSIRRSRRAWTCGAVVNSCNVRWISGKRNRNAVSSSEKLPAMAEPTTPSVSRPISPVDLRRRSDRLLGLCQHLQGGLLAPRMA